MTERRETRLYYHGYAKWGLSQKFHNPKLYLLYEVLIDREDNDEVKWEPVSVELGERIEISNLTNNLDITLNALAGFQNPKPVRLKGRLGSKWLTILVDSKSN